MQLEEDELMKRRHHGHATTEETKVRKRPLGNESQFIGFSKRFGLQGTSSRSW